MAQKKTKANFIDDVFIILLSDDIITKWWWRRCYPRLFSYLNRFYRWKENHDCIIEFDKTELRFFTMFNEIKKTKSKSGKVKIDTPWPFAFYRYPHKIRAKSPSLIFKVAPQKNIPSFFLALNYMWSCCWMYKNMNVCQRFLCSIGETESVLRTKMEQLIFFYVFLALSQT